jgi:hypothetical protein
MKPNGRLARIWPAVCEGHDAFNAGEAQNANPYPPHRPTKRLHDAWDNGWRSERNKQHYERTGTYAE